MPADVDYVFDNYKPRAQFVPFHNRLQRFACLVSHRGSGKTVAVCNDINRAAIDAPDGAKFAYIAPFLRQAKAVAWGYFHEAIAPLASLGFGFNESELRIDYGGGRTCRLFGADNPDAMRGNHFHAIVCDEFQDWDPAVWPLVVRPTLSVHQGRATFIGTPKGKNAFYQIYRDALKDPETWYTMLLKASESGLLSEADLANARKMLTEDQYAQEYEVSFDAAIHGAYYAKLIARAREDKRITGVPYDPSALVWTAWDLGIEDPTAIWFAQVVGREIHVIDYYEASGHDLGHFVSIVRQRPYNYAYHILPHDAEARELSTAKTRHETLRGLGLSPTRVLEAERIEEGINAAKLLIPKCWFDERRCERGIEALSQYRAAEDKRHIDPETKQPILTGKQVHDWTSHAADAFRYLAMGIDDKGHIANFNRKIAYPKYGIA